MKIVHGGYSSSESLIKATYQLHTTGTGSCFFYFFGRQNFKFISYSTNFGECELTTILLLCIIVWYGNKVKMKMIIEKCKWEWLCMLLYYHDYRKPQRYPWHWALPWLLPYHHVVGGKCWWSCLGFSTDNVFELIPNNMC